MRLPTLFTLIDFIKRWNPFTKKLVITYRQSGNENIVWQKGEPIVLCDHEPTFFSTRPKVIGNQNECGPMCENLISKGLSSEESANINIGHKTISKITNRVQVIANGKDITERFAATFDEESMTVTLTPKEGSKFDDVEGFVEMIYR